MSNGNGSNSVSIVAIVAILVLIGVVLYLVLRPSEGGDFELDVEIDTMGVVIPEAPRAAAAGLRSAETVGTVPDERTGVSSR